MPKHRGLLNKYLPYHHADVRSLSPGEVILLLAMHDVEGLRAASGLPSSLVLYFTNSSINSRTELSACMESMADKVRKIKHPLQRTITPCADYHRRNSGPEPSRADPIITGGITW